ncbi:hypothetical protein NL676_002876 [Syzygium grande]|nr:hypothetical protein NL676_002876 [Syzygium grande]
MDLVLGMATATLVVSNLHRPMEVVVARDTCIDPGSNTSCSSEMREIVRANARVTTRIITSRSSWWVATIKIRNPRPSGRTSLDQRPPPFPRVKFRTLVPTYPIRCASLEHIE